MNEQIVELEEMVALIKSAPTLEEMPRRTLMDKGINGPTAAHVIEEVHTPLNLAYLTFTTGSSAFQNIVGVTYEELSLRRKACRKAFEICGMLPGANMLVTYAPLVNVFSKGALEEAGVSCSFLKRSNRDGLLVALCKDKPNILLGESSFLRLTLAQAIELGLQDSLPEKLSLITAGTPLDMELLPVAQKLGYAVHDFYGCQEFGWLIVDGIPVREDLSLVASPLGPDYREVVVGGLPMGDSFPVGKGVHTCHPDGIVQTYKRKRTHPEYEVIIKASTRQSRDLIERTARTILRIKGRIVKVSNMLQLGAAENELHLSPSKVQGEEAFDSSQVVVLRGARQTALFDCMVEAQYAFQNSDKADPAWNKKR